jgi:hypothetical protein
MTYQFEEARMRNNKLLAQGEPYGNRKRFVLGMMALGTVLATQSLIAQDSTAQGKHKKDSNGSIGFILSGNAKEEDLGLPIYPGARQHKDEPEESPGLTMGLWGGSSGFKLVLLKLESDDAPEKVAAFYRKALARYGQVLECSKTSVKNEKADQDSKELTCDADEHEAAGLTLKAGTKERQHAVGIQPNGKHSLFQLVYVESPKSESQKN